MLVGGQAEVVAVAAVVAAAVAAAAVAAAPADGGDGDAKEEITGEMSSCGAPTPLTLLPCPTSS